MKRIVIAFCLGLALGARSHAAADAHAVLVAADAVRNPGRPFSMNLELVEYRGGKQVDSNVLAVFSKTDPVSARFRTIVQYLMPARDANKLLLKAGNDLWFYDPNSKASIRISPRERLLGEASNGDVVTANLNTDDTATIADEEDVQDGDKQTRHCFRLQLQAAVPDVTYDHMELWIDRDNSQTVKGKYFAPSGSLLKTVYFRQYRQNLDAIRPTEAVIIDGLDPGWVTVMRYSNYTYRDIPDSWFQRGYLTDFRP